MNKKIQVYSTIATSLLYALLAPLLFPTLNIFWILLGFILLLALIAKNWVDLILVIMVAGNVLLHQTMFPNLDDTRHIVQATAFTAFTFLQITLVIGPLTRINKRFAPLFRHRRHVGVATFLLAFIHANFVIAKYYDFNPELIYSINANYFGSTALIVLSALAFTSTNYFQTKLPTKYYNLIHTGLLLFYIAYTLGMSALGILNLETLHYVIFGGFVIFWILIAPWSLPTKLFLRVNAWKQLHYLVYLAYFSVIFHAWNGYFVLQPLPMQATFWITIICVISVHSYGWFLRLKKRKTQT
ncbi:ferric reductase-like transmembrane domain-containing protein [Candidatus Dojkabacteria bacterium]|uniref:Ferric reductase-like transmembrane domain-containing protein n=1 Tax=Candidatus Dojkabacteria bacterium TaxID=2099670 RepID=A0A955I679_9BACT|nr:ferric reductase-like transmembrane domain-containing protein [Candidatus Dojkabacteria bacterium]